MCIFVYVFRVFSVLYVCDVYVCLICENPGIDVVLTRAVFLLWSVGDRHRRVAVRRSHINTRAYLQSPFWGTYMYHGYRTW